MNRMGRILKRLGCETWRKIFLYDPITSQRIKHYDKGLIRLGSKYGGWTIPKYCVFQQAVCYCVGAGEDVSFDMELLEKDCKVWTFDPTPRALQYCENLIKDILSKEGNNTTVNDRVIRIRSEHIKNWHIVPKGLWTESKVIRFFMPKDEKHISCSIVNLQQTENYFDAPVDRLSNFMREFGHEHIDLLKLDVEGAASQILESLLEDKLNITVLCVEFDELGTEKDDQAVQKVKEILNKLELDGYDLVCIENLNYTFVKTRL